MIYPNNFESKIGFDQIREILKERCISPLGTYFIEKMGFIKDINKISKLISQTHELQVVLGNGEHFPQQDYYDVRPYLDIIKTIGRYIEPEELSEIALVVHTIYNIQEFIKTRDENLPEIPFTIELSNSIFVDKEVVMVIERVVDSKSQIKDGASESLFTIRKSLSEKKHQVEKRLISILKKAMHDGHISVDTQLTVRNGRSVIPIPASNKRSIKGFIHDESATGQTSFIEPAEIFELNNEIAELKYEERREIVKILAEVADKLRPHLDDLRNAMNTLGIIDFVLAKAKFSNTINAKRPFISENKELYLNKATHPILYLTHKQLNKPTVPLNIQLNTEDRIILISGPNAGGKSVCLKTVGLLQYMFQCGLPIPAEENSIMRVFDNIFIGIGDEQSIENDLSTYSSHLKSMNMLVNIANDSTLFLIDEFGAGTEPQLGGAIAESILEELNTKQAMGVANTHFSNLKHFAEKTSGVINAAMLFDTKKMLPLYILEIGKPGSSYAFEIAQNIGLPKDVIERARKKVGTTHYNYDKQLKDLEFEAIKLGQKASELENKEQHLNNLIKQYEDLKQGNAQLKDNINKSKQEILNEARTEALDIITNANKKIEGAIREIKENKGEKVITSEIRKIVEKEKESLQTTIKETTKSIKDKTPKIDKPIQAGDYVRMAGNTVTGKVVSLKKDQANVEFGTFMSFIKVDKLEKIEKGEYNKSQKQAASGNSVSNVSEKQANFKSRLDIRGKRAEEVYTLLQLFIDEAVLLSIKDITILHGKGNGILREVVRQYLSVIDDVESFRDESYELGGPGVTVVKLRSSL